MKHAWKIGGLAVLALSLAGNAVLIRRLDASQATSQRTSVRGHGVGHGRSSAAGRPAALTPQGNLADSEETTVQIFRQAAPSVAFITTLTYRESLFRRDATEIPRGTGSGFVWDKQGHIVTNFHVIQGASGARVTLDDQSTWRAALVGVAPDQDLAVLKIKAPTDKMRPLAIGGSNQLLVGQSVFAIGNPFGFDHTLSTGVISGLNREIMSASRRPIQDVIQTDAAINPGNSGGPLLDSSGRLIGVNTAIYSPSGAYAGIGFAVPVDTVQRVVPQLISDGKVSRPVIGVQIASKQIATRFGVKGVLILGVVPNGPAARAGIRPLQRDPGSGSFILGDVIVGLDGEAIAEPNDLYRLLDRRKVGDKVRLKLRRETKTIDLTLRLSEAED